MGYILKRVPNIFYSISETTRSPREGEKDGDHYHFRNLREFKEDIAKGEFLEWAEIYGDYYGTPFGPIESALKEGKTAILEIDVQGAEQVMEQLGKAAEYIFIAPPSLSELKRRLSKRNTENTDEIDKRMKVAIREMECADRYDRVIVNDDIDKASGKLAETLVGKTRG